MSDFLDLPGRRNRFALVASALLLFGCATTPREARTEKVASARHRVVDGAEARLALGADHSCMLSAKGEVRCWGSNANGQLGDGTVGGTRGRPGAAAIVTGATSLASGGAHVCAPGAGCALWCWGRGGAGAIGDGELVDRSSPVQLEDIDDASEVAAGDDHTCYVHHDATVSCWGANGAGQLGDGTTTARSAPVLAGLDKVSSIAAGGATTCAIRSDATVWCWGDNSSGELGDGTSTDRATPAAVPGVAGATQVVVGGSHACALLQDGSVTCWGGNRAGVDMAAVEPAPVDPGAPAKVPGLDGVVELTAGATHTCALLDDGAIRCWGGNASGELGNGVNADQPTPVAVDLDVEFKTLSAGGRHTCAMTVKGDVYCWGENASGQLGDGTTTDRSSPTRVLCVGPSASPDCAATRDGGVGDGGVGGVPGGGSDASTGGGDASVGGGDAPGGGCVRNPCGGCAALAEAPGDECGCGGKLSCAGPDALACTGGSPPNRCGGCDTLSATPGAACGCGGRYACAGQDDVVCSGERAKNSCGGCSRLGGTPGSTCATCGTCGRLACSGSEALSCTDVHAKNACGGCARLGALNASCGSCGTSVCSGSDAVRCAYDHGRNACGGCLPLRHAPGRSCGTCGTYGCNGADRVVCNDRPRNACGGCATLSGTPGAICGSCSTWACSGGDAVRCVSHGSGCGTIHVTKARIGCLDIQTEGNMTWLAAGACDGRTYCSYKAPSEDQYRRAGVRARTRSFCTQAMEITYQCGDGRTHVETVPGDAWKHGPAQLRCEAWRPPPPPPPPDTIHVTKARIGCLDIQTSGNLTGLVADACNGRASCSYKAPTEDQYRRAGVYARTRTFCSQAMEITYDCGHGDYQTAFVPGDAWNHGPASLRCNAPPPPAGDPLPPGADSITVVEARIGCMDIQKDANLTGVVGRACNGRSSCAYHAPTEDQYRRMGVRARTRTFCTQGMEIRYRCGPESPESTYQTVYVPGDAWDKPPAQLRCNTTASPPADQLPPGRNYVSVISARIGCLDVQKEGNLTGIVANACNNRTSCSFQAPTEAVYKSLGVSARTRTFCSQGMEITYRCGRNDPAIRPSADHDDLEKRTVVVEGDAWDHPPARLSCEGGTVATNRQSVTPPAEPSRCEAPVLDAPEYYIAPRDMLDWAPHESHGDYTFQGFRPPHPATRAMYRSPPGTRDGAPGSTLGANEGRVRAELRGAAQRKDALHDLCLAAQKFTRNRAASSETPSDRDFGNAFADLSVTGKASFADFVRRRPTEASLRAHAECAGASEASLTQALDRAYRVATALRGPHASPARRALGWVAVSGEDDQPYRAVNVPGTSFPQFDIRVDAPVRNPGSGHIAVNTRYMIAHTRPPAFPVVSCPLVDGGPSGRRVPADPLPALAPDAQVILFIHGMDSKTEEAEDLAAALHKLPGKNWTVISLDLPTSGYADNIDPGRISRAEDVACHYTPVVDFIEDFIVAFVDTLDGQLRGQLKPRIQAVVGGSLGGNMSMRLGRRPNAPWIRAVVPWSPAAIWPSFIGQRHAFAAGCDTGWDALHDIAVHQPLKWSGMESRFLPRNETPELRRELFYGGFDWAPVGGLGGPPQAQCWMSDRWECKQKVLLASRLDRHETYDANFRAWHWRLGAEQLAFSQQQHAPGTKTPLYLLNNKRMLLLCGYEDTCADLCKFTRDVAAKMVNTPGYARFMQATGHSLDNEHPYWVAREIAEFLR